MNLFLDSSVILAACGRPSGASARVFDIARRSGWSLLASGYVIEEVERNLRHRLPPAATGEWQRLRPSLRRVADEFTFDRTVLFKKGKDRPILFTAAAFSEVLLTLDCGDFGDLMAAGFYGLAIMTPGDFLRRERAAGRLRE